MATSKKIEEKYQKMLKEIQKRPENRHCFDCSGRGNQYVVLNYGVFVCTTCSGIHREEQHKIKSVGMSTFSTEEIKALERGGNGTAKSIWLAKACATRPRHPSHSASAPVTTPPLALRRRPRRGRTRHCYPRSRRRAGRHEAPRRPVSVSVLASAQPAAGFARSCGMHLRPTRPLPARQATQSEGQPPPEGDIPKIRAHIKAK